MSRILEPRAPSPHERLELVKGLIKDSVPTVVRYQPFIPGISDQDDSLIKLVKELKRIRVKHLIIETLSLPLDRFRLINKLMKGKIALHNIKLENYGTKEDSFFLRPSISWRRVSMQK